MNCYAHPDFEEIMKDELNQSCFDCSKKPAQWASVNNSIYLCLNCAGVHRGLGVNISYIRSIMMDAWNENQINMMKNGGNTRLKGLFNLYKLKPSLSQELLYSSKLLDFYRKLLKSEISGETKPIHPEQKEALLPSSPVITMTPPTINDKYVSVGSSSQSEKKTGFLNSLNDLMQSAVDKGKVITTTVKDKVREMDLSNKVKSTGALAFEKIVVASEIVKEKGNEAIQSSTVQTMKKKANQGYNYFYGKIFGVKTEIVEENSNTVKKIDDDIVITEEKYELNEISKQKEKNYPSSYK